MHIKDLKTNYAPAAMVNWQEAGRLWPRPHPHAARLLRRLVWDQHYRHSHPQCEGGMPGSFELREDMGEDRLRAVEEWLRAEGYEWRFRRKRWRTWTRPDRPGEGLRPDGIEEDETPNEYPSGASINVSMWDVIEKKVPELGTSAGCRAAARPLRRRSVPPGTGSGSGSGGSTRSPWPLKPPKAPGRNPSPQSPTGQWWSSPRLHHPWRLHQSCQADQGQAPSAAPEAPAGLSRPQQRRGVGPLREDAGHPGQLQQQRRSRPKGRGARL